MIGGENSLSKLSSSCFSEKEEVFQAKLSENKKEETKLGGKLESRQPLLFCGGRVDGETTVNTLMGPG